LRALDVVFLRVLAAQPERFPAYFRAIGERVPGDAFARFMGDASTPADEVRVIAALPKAPFARAALTPPRPGARGCRATAPLRPTAA
jgi:lycopene beta-cyclase